MNHRSWKHINLYSLRILEKYVGQCGEFGQSQKWLSLSLRSTYKHSAPTLSAVESAHLVACLRASKNIQQHPT